MNSPFNPHKVDDDPEGELGPRVQSNKMSENRQPCTNKHSAPTSVPRLLAVATITCALAFLFGQIFKSLFPSASHSYPLAAFQSSPDVSIRSAQLPAPQTEKTIPQPTNGWQIYFANNSYALTAEQKAWLMKLALSLKQCNALELVLIGSTSSAKYRIHNGERNLRLANMRAAEVGNVLSSELALRVINVFAWATFPELENERRYRDSRNNNDKENPVEFLNRRVDIVLGKSSDCPFLTAAMSSPVGRTTTVLR